MLSIVDIGDVVVDYTFATPFIESFAFLFRLISNSDIFIGILRAAFRRWFCKIFCLFFFFTPPERVQANRSNNKTRDFNGRTHVHIASINLQRDQEKKKK